MEEYEIETSVLGVPRLQYWHWGPVSGHKRRKRVFRTSASLQSAEIKTKSSFSIQRNKCKDDICLTLFA